MARFRVLAHWDAEAAVWWAESEDVPGLVTEAAAFEDLVQAIRELVPELLELNGVKVQGDIAISVLADRTEHVTMAA